MCDPPKIYPSLPEYTPLSTTNATLPEYTPPSQNIPPFSINLFVRPSQDPPLHLRLYLPFEKLYATLPESTYPSQNIPPFQQLHATLPESNPPPRIYLNFQQIFYYATLPQYTPHSTTYMRHSQKLPFPQRIHPSFLTTMCPFWEGGVDLGGSHVVVEKMGIFWEGGVDSGRVAYSC